jgi:diguanylate cyclase (GGDEF)-like protein
MGSGQHGEATAIVGRARRPGDWRIATRLGVLVLVPLVGLLLFAVSTIRLRTTAVAEAKEVQQDVERINRLVDVRAALFQEWAPSESAMALARLGLPVEQAGRVFDVDLEEQLRASRANTDAAVAALGDPDVLKPSDLTELRAVVDANPGAHGGDIAPFFDPPAARIDQALNRDIGHARLRMPQMEGAERVSDTLRATQNTIALSEATVDQLTTTAAAFLNPADNGTSSRQFAAQGARARLAAGELAGNTNPGVADAWRTVTTAEAYPRVQEELARIGKGDGPRLDAPDGLDRMGRLGRDAIAHEHNLFGLIAAANRASGETAAQITADAEAELRTSIALAVALVAAAVVVSVAVARSINRPLRRLAAHTGRVGAGDLDVAPLGDRGPQDLTVAFRAIDDLVANLRLLDAKSQALADLDFEAPVLAEPLPGRLGQALERSVSVVSGWIGERDAFQDRLLQQASQDPLTGVLNRAAAADHLEQALARVRRSELGLALLHVDLDDFQRINDNHGQAAGDRVLRDTARLLEEVTGDDALIARIGGDEFLVMVESVTDPGTVDDLARRLRDALRRTGDAHGGPVLVGGSIGLAFTWDGTDDAHDLLGRAELAVHRAKAHDGGGIEIYDEGLQEQLREQAEVEESLTAALGADELFLQYQPVIDLATGRMSSVEALVRWRRPEIGIRPPDTFIPVAERSDLIIDLDRWVMRRVATQLHEWASAPGLGDLQVAVNVSGRHLLSQTLYDHVVDLLDSTGIPAHRLVIEVTETVLVNDLVLAAAQLEAVRGLGVRIALDDFGTGYTSITHLRRLPIDIIKIDRSFVALLGQDRDRKLLQMIVELGHDLGVTIVAEGVETQEQYDTLRQLGCDRAQGYLMSRPLLVDDLQAWVRDQDEAPVA